MNQTNIFSFKFKFIDYKSYETTGYIGDNDLVLQEYKIPLTSISHTCSRDNKMKLAFYSHDKIDDFIASLIKEDTLTLEISGIKAVELEEKINRNSSVLFAELDKKKLDDEGKGDLFKSFNCPNCNSIIDFSEFKLSEYVYCRFCDSIIDQNLKVISDRNTFSYCDECNLFSFVKKYSILNLYSQFPILRIINKQVYLCGNCASSIGKKVLLQNLIFILGVPSAISMIRRASRNNEKGESALRKANECVLKGDYRTADNYFNELRSLYPHHPGIVYNQAKAHMIGKDYKTGVDYLFESLDYCSNYGPALSMVHQLNQSSNS